MNYFVSNIYRHGNKRQERAKIGTNKGNEVCKKILAREFFESTMKGNKQRTK